MKCKNEECPNCSNFVRGEYVPVQGRDFLTKGGKTLAVTALDQVVPFSGTVMDYLIGDTIDESLNELIDEFDDSEKFVFDCPKCGHKWTSFGRPSMPDHIIEQVRNQYTEELRKKRPYISSIIFSALSIFSTYGCYVATTMATEGDFMDSLEAGFSIIIYSLLLIVFIVIAIFKWSKIAALNREIAVCKNQTLQEFYHSNKNLFNDYKQYR